MKDSSQSRVRWFTIVIILGLLSSAPAAVFAAASGEHGSQKSSDLPPSVFSGVTTQTQTTQSPPLTAAAREGAAQGIQAALNRGVSLTADQQQAASLGAETAATAIPSYDLSMYQAEDAPFTLSSPNAEVTPDMVRAAASGAAFGTLVQSEELPLGTTEIQAAVSGAVLGSTLGAAAAIGRGGQISPTQIRAAAQGGAEGTAKQLTVVSVSAGSSLSTLDTNTLLGASFGGSMGAILAAGVLPLYDVESTPNHVYSAAFGGTAGAVQGTYSQQNAAVPRTAEQTAAAAAGSAAGPIWALLSTSQITPLAMRITAYESAVSVLEDPAVYTTDQLIEAALINVVTQFTEPPPADSLFPTPVTLSSGTVLPIVFQPRDPDDDGLYEDINGNSVLTYSDVIALIAIQDAPEQELTSEQEQALDFNGDCVFDTRDVWALDIEITGGPYPDSTEPPIAGSGVASAPCSDGS